MTYLILFFVFIFGAVIGSFLNCLIWRLHTGEGPGGRSYCPKCRAKIGWYDNIPVLSFILLKGKCRACGKKISWQYPVVELITGFLFVLAFYKNFSATGEFALSGQFSIFNFQSLFTFYFLLFTFKDWLFIAVMIVIFIYDLRWYLILDVVTLPAAAILLLLNMAIVFLSGAGWGGLRGYLISGIIGGSFFLFQFIISRGRWIGGGDIRLGLLLGLALGWPNVLIAIFLAYFMGSFVGLGLIISGRKQWSSKIPLGTFLSTAAVVTLFWGNNILNWYLGLFQ